MNPLRKIALALLGFAAMAGAAQASAAEFTTSSPGSVINTSLKEEASITVTGSTVECATTYFNGVAEGGATQRVHPVYENCTAFGLKASVDTLGCFYTFNANTGSGNHATLNLHGCNNGGITITVDLGFIAKCTVFIKNQSIENAAHYSDTSGRYDVRLTAQNVHAVVTTSDSLCPVSEGTHFNAQLYGWVELWISGGTLGYTP